MAGKKTAYKSLRDFIARLETAGELVRVTEPVSTVLQMTEIHRRLLHQGGPAVLFENVIRADGERSPMPCLVKLFGTVKRVAMGVTLEAASAPPRATCAKWASCWPSCARPRRRAASKPPWTCCRWPRRRCPCARRS